jgi:short-subunit dehydrogenase
MKLAVITGPTSGIGLAYAQELAREGYELLLVGRNEIKLKQLQLDLNAKSEIFVADLSVQAEILRVGSHLEGLKQIDLLVNNAGFGSSLPFSQNSLAEEIEQMEILMKAVMVLTHATLPKMIKQNSGIILNISSVAAWVPTGTYAAAKSWVTAFTESISAELKGSKVQVTAVAPGFTKTKFFDRSQMKDDDVPNWLWLTPEQVAKESLKDARSGQLISIPGAQYKAMSTVTRSLPRPLVRFFSHEFARKQKE